MTTADYVWLAGQAFGCWCIGFGAGALHKFWQQIMEKASTGD